MSKIYQILSKHFLGETNTEEEAQIKKFKGENPKEYELLAEVWKREKLEVKDYDSQKAWKKMRTETKKKEEKVIPMYARFLKIAASIAFLIFAMWGIRNIISTNSIEMMLAEATATERNKRVELADGSVAYLNSNAKLRYPSEFAADVRKVTLEGEAFFEVAENPTKPFTIATDHSAITVLGTSFNVNTNKEKTEVSVTTGKVQVASLQTQKTVLLTPGLSAIASQDELQSFETNDPNYLAWKTGEFTFDESPIKKVVEDLNSYYDNRIRISNPSATCGLTASFVQEELDAIMEVIHISCKLSIEKNNESYEIR